MDFTSARWHRTHLKTLRGLHRRTTRSYELVHRGETSIEVSLSEVICAWIDVDLRD